MNIAIHRHVYTHLPVCLSIAYKLFIIAVIIDMLFRKNRFIITIKNFNPDTNVALREYSKLTYGIISLQKFNNLCK